ncbi:MAG TPA: hypothetical protein VFN65_15355 [Solirubrobacteraceae bacterium]|nr:hypothetical protein [Solirubrobacteraceae bacterium]
METRSPDAAAAAARTQLEAARHAHDRAVDRATASTWGILALSAFCGVQTIAPAYRGPADVASVVSVVWLVTALVQMAIRHRWRSLASGPRPRWAAPEVTLICVAVLLGGFVGPHLLAGFGRTAVASWGLGAAVAVIVAGCMFAAYGSYRRRVRREWRR